MEFSINFVDLALEHILKLNLLSQVLQRHPSTARPRSRPRRGSIRVTRLHRGPSRRKKPNGRKTCPSLRRGNSVRPRLHPSADQRASRNLRRDGRKDHRQHQQQQQHRLRQHHKHRSQRRSRTHQNGLWLRLRRWKRSCQSTGSTPLTDRLCPLRRTGEASTATASAFRHSTSRTRPLNGRASIRPSTSTGTTTTTSPRRIRR